MAARLAVAWMVGLGSGGAAAQTESGNGNAATTLAGGALGAASLGILSSVGSLVPCRRTSSGRDCVRIFSASGAALGLAAGTLVGQSGTGELDAIARGAAYGSLGGMVAGLGYHLLATHSRWLDVVALTAVGGAIGTAPAGSAIGLAVGGAAGLILWLAQDGFSIPDAVGAGLAGMAVGALYEWFDRAGEANSGAKVMEIRIPLGRRR
jgi:hypothetical protein